jgi:hypothetical protein
MVEAMMLEVLFLLVILAVVLLVWGQMWQLERKALVGFLVVNNRL